MVFGEVITLSPAVVSDETGTVIPVLLQFGWANNESPVVNIAPSNENRLIDDRLG